MLSAATNHHRHLRLHEDDVSQDGSGYNERNKRNCHLRVTILVILCVISLSVAVTCVLVTGRIKYITLCLDNVMGLGDHDRVNPFAFLKAREMWILHHLVNPFLIHAMITHYNPLVPLAVKDARLSRYASYLAMLVTFAIISAWEMFEALVFSMYTYITKRFGIGSSGTISDWFGETVGDSWLGDIPQGVIGVIIAEIIVRRYPAIREHLWSRKNTRRKLRTIVMMILLWWIDVASLVNISLEGPVSVGFVTVTAVPIGYFLYLPMICAWTALLYGWDRDTHRELRIDLTRLINFYWDLLTVVVGAWLFTAALIPMTYPMLWMYAALVVLRMLSMPSSPLPHSPGNTEGARQWNPHEQAFLP